MSFKISILRKVMRRLTTIVRLAPQTCLPNLCKAKSLNAAEVEKFVPYTLRYTRLIRCSAYMVPYTLAYLAGPADFATTKRYVHPQLDAERTAIEKARSAKTPHNLGHSAKIEGETEKAESAAIN